MSDLITQLQDAVNQLADTFCNAVGILQHKTGPSILARKYRQFQHELGGGVSRGPTPPEPRLETEAVVDENFEDASLRFFPKLIAKNAKDLIALISALPPQSDREGEDEEAEGAGENSFTHLQAENEAAARELADVVTEARSLLNHVQGILLLGGVRCEETVRSGTEKVTYSDGDLG